ncbi:kinase-like protein [Pleomassaria siparia CBS 279.74]|uniref:Kinase-like protein n=1 Tax=Pleomassaria siparia CBS 279.74 TaxID=1314801 RepID=A0A6G1K191_9PLEO|nr:kinase-like protein [Pleomassaria siparia CBS 279.74]
MLMSLLFRIGDILKGRVGTYTVAKKLQESVWLRKPVVVKSLPDYPRVRNERDVLKRFQDRTRCLRPLVDEIVEPSDCLTIVLRHLQSDLLDVSIQKTLNRKELKYVCRQSLEALRVLYDDGFVHTDLKPDNVFVNFREGDLGGCYPVNSAWAKFGTLEGAPIWSNIWSFGAVLISLIHGGNLNLFRPRGMESRRQFRYFAFPAKFEQVAGPETINCILYLMHEIPLEQTTPFSQTTEREVTKKDKSFIGKIMMLDWRDRPTAT